MKNSYLKKIILVSFLFLLFIPHLTSAENKIFIKEYTYQASEEDSRNSCRTISLREVKRLLLEELGTYLESITEVQDFQLTKDQITTLTAGIVKTEIIEEKWDGRTYWLKSKIAADSREVIKSIDILRKDRVKTRELEEVRRQSEALLRENERLKKVLAVKTGKYRKENTAAYNKTIKDLTAIEWSEQGYAASQSGDLNDAIDAYSNAIALNPKYGQFYLRRGGAYFSLGKYDEAIKDFNKGIDTSPIISDVFYGLRGFAYFQLGNYNQAIKDYDKAIKQNPKNESAYTGRGRAYWNLGNHNKAMRDYDRSIEINPKEAYCYIIRGLAYSQLGNYNQAIQDYDKAIEIDPKDGGLYFNRGRAYAEIGDARYLMDIKTAARLGIKVAQDFLKKEGMSW